MIDIFEKCRLISKLLETDENHARQDLIKLLEYLTSNGVEFDPLVNHLLRKTGLYPYISTDTSHWEDRFVHEAFKADVGEREPKVLHREQSYLLKRLLEGDSIAVSAPTSFGKSFVIDALISIKEPKNIVIIVPTIALMDETRRRIYKKFSHKYKIITTSDETLLDRNIFIFPQERAIQYIDKINHIDILIIDEFYKASEELEKDRSSVLIRAILKLGKKSNQKYFLAPNISNLKENQITKGMEFIHLDFNTVFLNEHTEWKSIQSDQDKESLLLKILAKKDKTLVYAGTFTEIDNISKFLIQNYAEDQKRKLLNQFSIWLTENYKQNYLLAKLVKKGIGVHNGKLHRALSQIQIKLFEEENGLDTIISTSSIIEGVNTSAKNVVIWKNKNGSSNLNNFTFKNIMGRGGRMFRHFVGDIYIFEEPKSRDDIVLELSFPDEILGAFDKDDFQDTFSEGQIAKIIEHDLQMSEILGESEYKKLKKSNAFQSSSTDLIRDIALNMSMNPDEWNGLSFLNSDKPENWDRLLYKVIGLSPAGWGDAHKKTVETIKILSQKNWIYTIPKILLELEDQKVTINDLFQIERNITFRLSALLNDVNILQQVLFPSLRCDISPFIAKCSHAFLPKIVYQLEEFGLPRMISKKVHCQKILDLCNDEASIHEILEEFKKIGLEKIKSYSIFSDFDKYIIDHFYDGITVDREF